VSVSTHSEPCILLTTSRDLTPATHCGTLQHIAAHCNALQHPASPYNTLQHTATNCNALEHDIDQLACCKTCHNPPDPATQQHIAAYSSTLQHHEGTTLHHAAPHSPTFHHTATRCNTLQHSNLLVDLHVFWPNVDEVSPMGWTISRLLEIIGLFCKRAS